MANPADGVLARLGITTTAALGAIAISIIGLANIAARSPPAPSASTSKEVPAGADLPRPDPGLGGFILTPMTPASVLVFSALMGALWLATVPLTSGLSRIFTDCATWARSTGSFS